MSISIKTNKRGMSIRATGSSDCRGVLEAMGFQVGEGKVTPAKEVPISPDALQRVMTSRQAQRNPQIAVAAWNNAVSVGQLVEYREVYDSEPKRFKTRTQAELLSGHTAVVWLEGKSGCVCCTHCIPVVESRPTCAVRGLVAPGAMCSKIIVGGNTCGAEGACVHQREVSHAA